MLTEVIENKIHQALKQAVTADIIPEVFHGTKISKPENKAHGDWSVNIAMVGAKIVGKAPRELAADLAPFLLEIDVVENVDIAGPGFLNLFLDSEFEGLVFQDFRHWLTNGATLTAPKTEKILVEYVSANPTGPLHVGHGRGAVVGDAVVRLLRRVGHEVTAEYYVNDAGNQMQNLGKSVRARMLEMRGESMTFPEDLYQGNYVVDIASDFTEELENAGELDAFWKHSEPEQISACRKVATQRILDGIRQDLEGFGVNFDHWQSELVFHENGQVQANIDALLEQGSAVNRDGTIWFQSDNFGDEKPRVIVRDTGEPTYFAADIAYHKHKFEQGYDRAIDFWGADHHGYEPRVRAAMQALELPESQLEIHFIQFVTLLKDGEAISMSTRSGKFECLSDVVAEVGRDAARFFYLLRRPESHLDFDLDLAKKQANENPVYYVQYAHARVCSILQRASEEGIHQGEFKPQDLADAADRDLLNILLNYPEIVQQAALDRAPHQIVFYLQSIAAAFHGYYNKQRILDDAQPSRISARLALATAVKTVIADALALIGVTAPERM